MALPPETHKIQARPQQRHMVSSAGVENVTAALTATPRSDLNTQVGSFRDEQEVPLWYRCLQHSQTACGVRERELRFTRDSEYRIQTRNVAYLYPYKLG
jgi:hypothetical protein